MHYVFFFFFLGGGGYLSMPWLHDYNVKRPNFMFCGGCELKTTNLIQLIGSMSPKFDV